MATTTATITINSTDLVTDELSLSSSSTLTNAGGSTGVTQTTGLARRTTSAAAAAGIQAVNVYRAGDDTWEFDGVTMTAADSTTANIAAQIDALNYPNWTTTHVATESTIIFTARYASSASEEVWVTADGTLDTAGNGTANISAAAVGSKSQSDITIRPSVHTAMTYESLLIHE